MPEGPEVARTSEALHKHLQNTVLLGGSILPSSRYYKLGGFPGAHLLQAGSKVRQVWAKAKKIIFEFEYYNTIIYLVSFLGMEGHWIRNSTKHTGIYFKFGHIIKHKNTQIRIIYNTFYYEDVRHMGTLAVYTNTNELTSVFKAIGPDLLQDQIPFEYYYSILRKPSVTNKEIAWFLLQQKFFSGIGNYLKSEVLYLAQIAPFRLLGSLTDDEIKKLYEYSLSTIKLAYDNYGLTIASYVDPDGRKGTYNPHVYGKNFDSYGNPINKIVLSEGRTTHWVPNVQK